MGLPEPDARSKGMGPVAGPPIVAGISNHSGSYRVQFDVSQAGEEVSVFLDEAVTSPPLEKRFMKFGVRLKGQSNPTNNVGSLLLASAANRHRMKKL
jgi:hypothetical protein